MNRKKTLRILLATAALAVVALTIALQPGEQAMAGGPMGSTGTNGISLDGVAIAADAAR